MLDFTKIQETDSFKTLAECIQNSTIELVITCNTFVGLDPNLGYDYFLGNISNRGRYDDFVYRTFIMMIITYLRPINLELAKKLQENKEKL
jgi:hypothetical protein